MEEEVAFHDPVLAPARRQRCVCAIDLADEGAVTGCKEAATRQRMCWHYCGRHISCLDVADLMQHLYSSYLFDEPSEFKRNTLSDSRCTIIDR